MTGWGSNSVTFSQRLLAIPPGVSPGAHRLVHPNNRKCVIPGMSDPSRVLLSDWFNFDLCYAHWSNVLLNTIFIRLFRVTRNTCKLLQTIDGLGTEQCVTENKWQFAVVKIRH